MTTTFTLVIATVVLGVGTFAFRFAGPVLRARIQLPPRVEKMAAISAVVLLAALVATAALLEGQEFAGIARPTGVLVGGVLAWKKAPFIVVVMAAGATAAVLRLFGVP